MKVFVIGFRSEIYANWIPEVQLVRDMVEADIVMFTGGEDVDPSLYNEPVGRMTYTNLIRDTLEQVEFEKAFELHKPMIGICRGSQFGCVMSGGRLVQDQLNPGFLHEMKTSDGRTLMMTSTHHQAQYPYELPEKNYKLLAWTEGLCGHHWNGENKEISEKPFKEAEIVYYPTTRFLAIQGHPEMVWAARNQRKAEFVGMFEYLHELVNKLVNNKL